MHISLLLCCIQQKIYILKNKLEEGSHYYQKLLRNSPYIKLNMCNLSKFDPHPAVIQMV